MRGKLRLLSLIIICLLSVGCTRNINKEDLISILESNKDLLEEENLSKKMVEKTRKTDGDYSIFQPHISSKDDGEIYKAFPNSFVDIYELTLEINKDYNIQIYSEYYESDVLKKTETIFDDVITSSEDMYIINDSKHDLSKRDLLLHFATKDKILKSVEYYLPANWNQYSFLFNDAFDDGETIPLIVYERGIQVKDGKYKTASCNLTLEDEKREKSITKAMKKNAQTVIIKMKIEEIHL